MTDHIPDEVSPAGRDLRAYTDELRPDHPVVRNDRGEWVLLRHDLVRRAALDDVELLQRGVPLSAGPQRAGRCAAHRVSGGTGPVPGPGGTRAVPSKSSTRSLPNWSGRCRGAPRWRRSGRSVPPSRSERRAPGWVGPRSLEGRLLAWIEENHAATRSGDSARTAQVAEEFDDIIRSVLAQRRCESSPDRRHRRVAPGSMCTGGELADAEIVSVLRNWTGGDLGSIALCVGVLVHNLASRPELQSRLREGVLDAELDLGHRRGVAN